jgi:gliding motility-associated-like protein
MKKEIHITFFGIIFFFIMQLAAIAQPITQFQQFNGRFDYVAIGNTLNLAENGTGAPCNILTSSSATLNLTPQQTLVAAYLYWAGSGSGDFNVLLNGVPKVATRTFTTTINSLPFFGAFTDVTSQLLLTGNGVYTLSELDLTGDIPPYCGGGLNFGGWSIIIVYEEATLTNNQLSVYDGFERVFSGNPLLEIQLQDLNVISTLGAKIGFLAWEGDATIALNETVSINGTIISNPPLNPANNAFNSTNSFTGSTDLWNMDLDFYNIESEVSVGDTTMDVTLTSGQDGVIIHNIVVVLASELPDATIVIDDVGLVCDSRDIAVDFTVFNTNSTDFLPANTPISFYADGILVGTFATIADIPINGSESNTVNLTIPIGVPNTFTLTAVVDDIGNGTGNIPESNENNNDFTEDVTLIFNPIAGPVSTIVVCDLNNDGFATFFLLVAEAELLGTQTDIMVTYYETLINAEDGINPIVNPNAYTNIDFPTQTIFVRLENNITGCYITSSFLIEVRPVDFLPFALENLEFCFDGPLETGHLIDLTVQEAFIFGGGDPSDYTVTYHLNQLDAAAGINAIPNPNIYPNIINPQVIWVRLVNNVINCVEIGSFSIQIYLNPIVTQPDDMTPYELCDDLIADGFTEFDLITKIPEITVVSPNITLTFHESQVDADNNINSLPFLAYINILNPQTIYVRVTDTDSGCVVFTNFQLVVLENPIVNLSSSLILCDEDNNGFAPFTLSDADMDITLGDPLLSVTYHGTELDAINGIFSLPNPYVNDSPYEDEVWARVESSVSSCYTIVRLLLYVRNTPQVVTPEPLRLCDYNNPGDGFEVFDLTQAAPEILNGLDPTHYDLYYYVNQSDAVVAGDSALLAPPGDYSQAIVTPGAYQNQVPFNQIIYVLVVGNANSIDPSTDPASNGESCYAVVELELIVDPLPVANLPLPYELCDDEINGSTLTDELSTFDLTTRNIEITGGDLTLNVTWYETPADEAADNAIVDPTAYQNRTIAPATQPTPQTIVARVTDIRGCKSTTTLTLVVLPNPIANAPTAIEECDSGLNLDDGIATFDLTQRDSQIIGIQTDVTVTYYTTQGAAEAGVAGTEIANPTTYVNTIPYLDSVWARVEKIVTPPSVSPACYDVIELQLIVVPLPDVPTAGFGDLFSCDQDGDGNALFDLTQNSPFVIGLQPPSDFIGPNYYINIFDAAAGVPGTEIATPALFLSTSSPQPIWVRIESLLTGCVRISSFNLIVGTFPTIVNPLDKEACDDIESGSDTDGITIFDLTQYTEEITGGNGSYEVIYYATQQDQIDNTPILNPSAYANAISPEQTIYVSVLNTEGCEAQTTLLLRVLPLPNAIDAEYALCDPDNDGYAFFDLETMTVVIANGETDVLITYYETLLDAEEGVNALDTTVPYENLSTPMQTLWVRVIRDIVPPSTTPACYTVVELTLMVNPTPVVPLVIDAIVLCDPDEIAEFDLTQHQEFIYGTQDPLAYTLTYHETLLDAEAGTNAIVNPETYTNTSNPQTIYVRLTDNETGCYKVSSFEIEISVGPVANLPTPLDSCDDLGEPNDGITTFDLTQKEDEITGGVAGVEVRFYELEEDAQNDINRIDPETAYVNTVNLQTIYVRVIDGNTGCVSFTRLLLRVFPNPSPTVPDALELCDDNNAGDGIEAFNLLDAQAQILNGANWDVLYYATQAEALLGDPTQAIDSSVPYENTTPWLQILYVRVTNATTGCFEIVELTLIVHPLPDDSAVLEDLIACEINTDGVATFNLEDKIGEILNGQDPLLHTITFYRTDVEAQSGLNPIVNTTTFQNTINPEPIYTGILNTETGCYIGGVQFFLLRVLEGATATTPAAPLIVCEDEEGSGIGTFDLSILNAEILNGQDPNLYIVTYHESLAEADSGANPIASTTTNYQSPTATLWARVTFPIADPERPFPAGCYAVVEVQLVVNPLPILALQESYRLCVDAFGNPIEEEFGSTSPPVIDTGLSTPEYRFIWEIDGQLQFGETQGSIVASQAGVYTVTATNQATGCENSASTTVVLSSPPLVYDAQTTSGAFAGVHTIEASASGLGSYVYQLDDGPFQNSGIFENVSPGSHIITITDENGCGSVEIEVGVIDYPRFFTPNNDGFHERWNIIGIATNPTAKIYIFDRHGKLIKQISPTSAGWDGTYNGNPLPSSDYWFRVEYTEDDTQKQFRGHFTLKR